MHFTINMVCLYRTRNPCSNENNRISSGRHHNQHRYKSTPRTGSNFHSPAQKYPNSNELRGFDAIQSRSNSLYCLI